MIGGVLLLVIGGVLSFGLIDQLKTKHPFIDIGFLRKLFFYHLALSLAYYLYAVFNPSDSKFYYEKVLVDFRGPTWSSFYGTSTTFIEFIAYPFIKYFGLSYEAMMALFSLMGFLGFVFFYIFFRENIRFKHKILGIDLFTLIFFLPNLHFWSSSLGKGSIIFFGLGLYFFGLANFRKRILPLIVGGFIIYHVRPHVMFVILLSSAFGLIFSSKGISIAWRLLFVAGASVAFFVIYSDVLRMVGMEEDTSKQAFDLTHRATELTKATSGVDITSYSLPMQLFTFLYRPLFIDAPGMLGFIVSFENVIYLIITVSLIRQLKGLMYPVKGNFLVKSAFFSFLTVSIALAQISGNLGLAMRQKSQVMILFMFVVISFLDDQKLQKYLVMQRRKQQKKRMQEKLAAASQDKPVT